HLLVKDNNLFVKSNIMNENGKELFKSNIEFYDKYPMLFYNTVYMLDVTLNNFQDIRLHKKSISINISITDEEGKEEALSSLRLINNEKKENIEIVNNSIKLDERYV